MDVKNQWYGMKTVVMPVLTLGLGIVVLVFYNNCTTRQNSQDQKPIVASLSSEDIHTLKASLGDESQAFCEESQIFCRRFVFGSDLKDSNDLKPYCFDSEVSGKEVCVQVFEFHYNSSKAVSEQNYEEAYCFDFDINQRVGKEVRHHADNIDGAIEKTLQVCKENL